MSRETKPWSMKNVFGDSLVLGLPSQSRKRRKRQASKRRREILRKDMQRIREET